MNEPHALQCAVKAAKAAGKLMRDNFRSAKKIDAETQHDIKLELDRSCQALIERTLLRVYPTFAVLGEEGVRGSDDAEFRWVIDPIDGTVNFTYGIPYCCVSIALQERMNAAQAPSSKLQASKNRQAPKFKANSFDTAASPPQEYSTVVGVVYDPFCNELWTATRKGKALLTGRAISVSSRGKLSETIVAMGFAKEGATLKRMLPRFNALVPRVRKIRMMGAAALSMVYVATGRHDAYLEYGVRLWDIAAGGLILERAGGEFWHEHLGDNAFHVLANNGRIRRQIQAAIK